MVDVTILADNTVATPFPPRLRGEWGFSAAVDNILFDTGHSESAWYNACTLGLPMDFDAIALSHTHVDHTGGILRFLNALDQPDVYVHPNFWEPRYVMPEDVPGEVPPDGAPIGIPFAKPTLERKATIHEHREPVTIDEGVHVLGEIPRPFEETTAGKIEVEGELLADDVLDDRALAIETSEGVLLVLGCCHAGLRNTIVHAEDVCGEGVRYVVGGTHLVDLDEATIHELADWLDGRVDVFAGCHCTGSTAQSILRDRLPDAFESVGVGSRLEFPG